MKKDHLKFLDYILTLSHLAVIKKTATADKSPVDYTVMLHRAETHINELSSLELEPLALDRLELAKETHRRMTPTAKALAVCLYSRVTSKLSEKLVRNAGPLTDARAVLDEFIAGYAPAEEVLKAIDAFLATMLWNIDYYHTFGSARVTFTDETHEELTRFYSEVEELREKAWVALLLEESSEQ